MLQKTEPFYFRKFKRILREQMEDAKEKEKKEETKEEKRQQFGNTKISLSFT